jgi:hypothetical protein
MNVHLLLAWAIEYFIRYVAKTQRDIDLATSFREQEFLFEQFTEDRKITNRFIFDAHILWTTIVEPDDCWATPAIMAGITERSK